MKTISFITPCYNDGDTIEKLIKSLVDQDLSDIEIIVVNDGSTDNSKIILDGLKEIYPINIIHFEKNKGACVARNEGAKIAQGKYFSFLPADAILYPGMARVWFNNLEEQPDYDFLYGGYRLIDEDGEPIPGQ
ncbi:MAG: glycosyltransferase family 2 protein, partial [Bacteroidetes bacterium]|nr:glycosyltransferase family 2 protein [Bacteroidota bacterium]